MKPPRSRGPGPYEPTIPKRDEATAKVWFEWRFQSEREVSMKNSKPRDGTIEWLGRQQTVASSRPTSQSDIRRTSDVV